MKITIITVVYNNIATISDAIDSVLTQTYNNIEYIVIDGGSNDGTVEKVQSYEKGIDKLVSEKDRGIYDAMNKGIALATGDIVGILNSDDVYFDENVIDSVIKNFKKKQTDCVYGDLYYVEKNDLNKIIRYWKSSKFKAGSFAQGWHPPHPTFFLKKEVYEKYGLFDLKMKVSADFDLMLRLLERHQISTSYLSKVLVKMRLGGESNRSLKNIIISNKTILKSFDKNKIKVNKFAYIFYRLIPKVIQMIKKGR